MHKSVTAKVPTGRTDIYLPLDFSYFGLEDPSDILKGQPRIGAPLTLSTLKDGNQKWLTTSLKLNNNSLYDLTGFQAILKELYPNENWLTWLDLSCNSFTNVPMEIGQLKNLKMLYLHGNKIKHTRDLLKLRELPKLTKLTVHGNPVELETGYFSTVLKILPQLVKLDFTAISPNDQLAAQIDENRKKKKKKRKAKNT